MTNLIQQAEALEAQARELREQAAREPLRLWVNVSSDGTAYAHKFKAIAEGTAIGQRGYQRTAVPMVEVRPGYALVKVPTHEDLLGAYNKGRCAAGFDPKGALPYYDRIFCRAFANELGLRDSLAGVEVEK